MILLDYSWFVSVTFDICSRLVLRYSCTLRDDWNHIKIKQDCLNWETNYWATEDKGMIPPHCVTNETRSWILIIVWPRVWSRLNRENSWPSSMKELTWVRRRLLKKLTWVWRRLCQLASCSRLEGAAGSAESTFVRFFVIIVIIEIIGIIVIIMIIEVIGITAFEQKSTFCWMLSRRRTR